MKANSVVTKLVLRKLTKYFYVQSCHDEIVSPGTLCCFRREFGGWVWDASDFKGIDEVRLHTVPPFLCAPLFRCPIPNSLVSGVTGTSPLFAGLAPDRQTRGGEGFLYEVLLPQGPLPVLDTPPPKLAILGSGVTGRIGGGGGEGLSSHPPPGAAGGAAGATPPSHFSSSHCPPSPVQRSLCATIGQMLKRLYFSSISYFSPRHSQTITSTTHVCFFILHSHHHTS